MNILRDSLFLLGILKLCGSTLTFAVTRRFDTFSFDFLFFFALVLALELLLRKSAVARRFCFVLPGRLNVLNPVLVFVLTFAIAFWQGNYGVGELRQIDSSLGLYASYEVSESNGCHLRGSLPKPRNERAGEVVVTVIGDSFIYGTQLASDETLAATLTQTLSAAGGRAVVATNAGVPGASIGSYARMMAYTRSCIDPDAFLVYLSDSDDDDQDIHDRMRSVAESPLKLVAVAINAETAYDEYVKQILRKSELNPNEHLAATVEKGLLALATEAKSRRLLIVSKLPGKHRALLRKFADKHPEIGVVDVSASLPFASAEVGPDGVHWSPAGTRKVAQILTPYALWLVSGQGSAPRVFEGSAELLGREEALPVQDRSNVRDQVLVLLGKKTKVRPGLQADEFIWNHPKLGRDIRLSAFSCQGAKGYFHKHGAFCFALREQVLGLPEDELRADLDALLSTP